MSKAKPPAAADADLHLPSRPLESAQLVPITLIDPNPFQPRHAIPEYDVAELTASIQASGLIEPLIVCPNSHRYTLIAGYRRLTAARKAALVEVPCIVRKGTDSELLELALLENIQRA